MCPDTSRLLSVGPLLARRVVPGGGGGAAVGGAITDNTVVWAEKEVICTLFHFRFCYLKG